ncbi:MAG: protein kinase [Cyanobacteria bacterium REEB67]|nr:protein kinase [Cyanobacteria bacterium REEB67]
MDSYEGKLDYTPIKLQSGGKTSRLLESGDIIGETYRLKGLIGRGGMGYVFSAEHLVLHQDYALKVLAPDQVNPVSWQRFQSEGRAIARLDHANIVKIYNMGVDGGDCPYYVMDLLYGVTLSECIADKLALSLAEIVDMFIQLAAGFGYAHARGIVHRDVKPGNIVLVDSGARYPTPKIVDFGIAKLASGEQQSLTAPGEIFGSPYYMSPEQCMGNEIDQRADIYSLGCTLFETLAGQPPFKGESALHTVVMHQQASPPTLESMGSRFASDEMEAILGKMLAKRPADRYQTMEQLAHDLERLRANKTVGKVLETGFRTAADSHFEIMDRRFAVDRAGARQRNRIVTAIVCATAVFVTIAGARFFVFAARPTARAPLILLSADRSTRHDQALAAARRVDPELDRQRACFAGLKKIESTVDAKSGMRIFHFPQIPIGELTWAHGALDVAGFDNYVPDDISVAARGDVPVPPNIPIYLSLDFGRDRGAWSTPEVLTKFGANELNGLILNSENLLDTFLDEKQEADEDGRTVALVEATASWRDLQYLKFYKVRQPDSIFKSLSRHKKTLKKLVIHETSVTAAALAGADILSSLESLSCVGFADFDQVLVGLRGSTHLKELSLKECSVSADGLNALANCPSLTLLRLEQHSLDSASLLALGKIKSLKALDIAGCRIKPEQIPELAKLKFIGELRMRLLDWRPSDRQKLFALLPQVNSAARAVMARRQKLGLPPLPYETHSIAY